MVLLACLNQLLQQHGALKIKKACKLLSERLGHDNDGDAIKRKLKKELKNSSEFHVVNKVISFTSRAQGAAREDAAAPEASSSAQRHSKEAASAEEQQRPRLQAQLEKRQQQQQQQLAEEPRTKSKKRRTQQQQLLHEQQEDQVASEVVTLATAAANDEIFGPKLKRKRLLDTSWKEDYYRQDAKHGLFSDTEKETLRAAVMEYASAHSLDAADLGWLFKLGKRGQKGAITTIATSLPHRSRAAVYYCLQRMCHPGNYKGRWSREEDDTLLQLVEQQGQRWVPIGDALGRLGDACRDRFRLIKNREQLQRGSWSSIEEEKLKELVAELLEERAAQPLQQVGPAGSMRDSAKATIDNINWDWVADQMGSRNANSCMKKWYNELSPSMVERGDWGPGDDKRLLRALLASEAQYEWEVAWGELVQGRSAQQSLRRWRLMLKCVPQHRQRELHELVGYLVDQYAPRLRHEQQQQGQQKQDAGE